MLLQFEHLADQYFAQAESDVGERELDLASSIDCDLDTFYATVALTKGTLESALNEEGQSIATGVSILKTDSVSQIL